MRVLSAEEVRANEAFVRGCPVPLGERALVYLGPVNRLDIVLPVCPDCGAAPEFWGRQGWPELVIGYPHAPQCPQEQVVGHA